MVASGSACESLRWQARFTCAQEHPCEEGDANLAASLWQTLAATVCDIPGELRGMRAVLISAHVCGRSLVNVRTAARICQVSIEMQECKVAVPTCVAIQYSDCSTAHVQEGHGPAASAQGQSSAERPAAYLNEEQRLQLENRPAYEEKGCCWSETC